MNIGTRVYYRTDTGAFIWATGDRAGDVVEISVDKEVAMNPVFSQLASSEYDYLQLGYGEFDQFRGQGGIVSVKLDTKSLILKPYFPVACDKPSIASDGVDTATITATTNESEVIFTVLGTEFPITVTDGKAVLPFASKVIGRYVINARTATDFGQSIVIEVI